jgi:hypothetical protein
MLASPERLPAAPCDPLAAMGDLCFGRNLSSSRRNEDSVRTDPRDAQLVAAGLGGDHEAFAALADRHRHRAGAVVLAMLGDPAEAEDVMQEALLRAYTDLGRLRDPPLWRLALRNRGQPGQDAAAAEERTALTRGVRRQARPSRDAGRFARARA